MADEGFQQTFAVHPRHPFPEYAPHVDLMERLSKERFFHFEVCPNGHVRQTAFPTERYPCHERGCHRSVRVPTRWFVETLRAAERGLTRMGDRL